MFVTEWVFVVNRVLMNSYMFTRNLRRTGGYKLFNRDCFFNNYCRLGMLVIGIKSIQLICTIILLEMTSFTMWHTFNHERLYHFYILVCIFCLLAWIVTRCLWKTLYVINYLLILIFIQLDGSSALIDQNMIFFELYPN